MPAQDDLGGRHPEPLGAAATAGSSYGAARLPSGLHASVCSPLGMGGAHLGLGKARVQLDLVDRRHHARLGDDPVEVGWVKFETPIDAPAARLQLDQRPPCLDVQPDRRVGPVDEVQVEVVEPEPLSVPADEIVSS